MSVDDELRDLLDGSIAEALAASEVEVAQLHVAMKNRTLIGQASGMLMILLDISEEQAFAYLRRVSMHENRKITDIAGEIVRTRAIPQSD